MSTCDLQFWSTSYNFFTLVYRELCLPFSQSFVLEVHEERDGVPELLHTSLHHLGGTRALDVARQLLERLDIVLDAVHKVVDVQVGPQRLRPLLSRSL